MKFVLTNARTLIGGGDLSGDVNEVGISATRAEIDVTNYNSGGWNEYIAGLGQAKLTVNGFWEAGSLGVVDDNAWANFAALGGVTVAPQGAADQALCYLTNVLESSYDVWGKVGEAASFKLAASSSWPLVRGVIALPPGNALTASGTGTINNLGAVATGQYLYANLNALSFAGTSPSIAVVVQSAATSGFGSPTTRITFTTATAAGGQIARVAGPITDAYWRVSYTVTGTTPSILAGVSFGIQ
jgi:hypothetical protein